MPDVPWVVMIAVLASIPAVSYAGLMRDDISDFFFALVAACLICAGIGITDDIRALAWIGSIAMFVISWPVAVGIYLRRKRQKESSQR